MSQYNSFAASVTPTQHNISRHGRSLSNQSQNATFTAKDAALTQDARSIANTLAFGPRNASLLPSGAPPGSFSSDLKNINFARVGTPGIPKAEGGATVNDDYFGKAAVVSTEQKQKQLRDKINKETKIKVGSENLLEALVAKNAKQTRDQRQRVENELSLTNRKLVELNSLLDDEVEKAKRPTTPSRDRLSGLFQSSPLKTPGNNDGDLDGVQPDEASESPSFALDSILQNLDVDGMQPDYYVENANRLVNLFKRYPTLKYDLAWSIFGDRAQTMLLSDSREVVAAGYRVIRHAITDHRSLQTIRGLHTDDLAMLSLVKEGKASIEREQALKFLRAFLDVKGGIDELSLALLRTIVAVAEHVEDRLRNMAILTLAEVLVQSPSKACSAGAIGPLADALVEGSYYGAESLASVFLQMEDCPHTRAYLRSGYELDIAFTPFTDPAIGKGHDERLKSNARLISALLKTWPGLFAVSRRQFMAVHGLLKSLQYDVPVAQELILDILFDVLHITPPSWTSSFLAGRRLTTYGRVANMRADDSSASSQSEVLEEENTNINLVQHFTTLLLAVFLQCGLIQVSTMIILY